MTDMANGGLGALAREEAGSDPPPARVWHTAVPPRTRLRRVVLAPERGWQVLIALTLLGLWQYLGARSDRYVFAPPSTVVHTAADMIGSGELARALGSSLADLGVGFTVSALLGLIVGFAMGAHETVGRALNPFVAALAAVPTVALVPVIVAWTGIGLTSRVIVIVLFAVFEPLYVARAGVREVDRELHEAARMFGAGAMARLRWVSLPATLPFVFTGLRLAAVRAVKGMVIAQILISSYGLGGLITASANAFRIDKVLVVAMSLGVLAVVLSALVGVAERTLVRRPR
jgi:ABC-type nitrate/sulfonate/bicarbonate transport system permease component